MQVDREVSSTPDKASRKEEDNEDGPLDGVGCFKGCLRDTHCVITILSTALMTLPIVWLLDIIEKNTFLGVEIPLGVVYLVCSFCFSNSHAYLCNVIVTEGVMAHMERMYSSPPEIRWHIKCFHEEKITKTTKTWEDGSVRTEKETIGYETVYTHSAYGCLKFAAWNDVSTPLKQSEIENYTMTKVSVKKRWICNDGGYERQKRAFIRRNDVDRDYTFSEEFHVKGYQPRFLGFINVKDKPCLAHWTWYWLSHLTVVFALPYRMWLSSKTGKVRIELVKEMWTVGA